jgi:hypothetical protein
LHPQYYLQERFFRLQSTSLTTMTLPRALAVEAFSIKANFYFISLTRRPSELIPRNQKAARRDHDQNGLHQAAYRLPS